MKNLGIDNSTLFFTYRIVKLYSEIHIILQCKYKANVDFFPMYQCFFNITKIMILCIINVTMIYFVIMFHENFLVKIMKTCILLKINLKTKLKLLFKKCIVVTYNH